MARELIALLADGDFHSGQELGQKLGVSRAAVWKRLQRLQELGLELERLRGKGYRVPGGLDLLDADRIRLGMDAHAQSVPVDLVEMTGSTNTDLLDQLRTGVDTPRALVTEYQHGGRGRRSRSWLSPYGRSLYLSLAWPFSGGAAQLEGLSLTVGTVLAEQLVSEGLHGVGLKWPNDVLVDGHKLAGILIELAGDVDGPCTAVIGIGVNGNLAGISGDAIDQSWTDLRRELGLTPDRNRLLAGILSELALTLPIFASNGFRAMKDRWRRFDLARHRAVSIEVGEQTYHGRAEDVTDTGALVVNMNDEYRHFHGGEVSLTLASGAG
jgi:BirA family biotin operon repressor/biotin-[acetyl-CoA-carboxylase] ligase